VVPRRRLRAGRRHAGGAFRRFALWLALAGLAGAAQADCVAPGRDATAMPETIAAPWTGSGGVYHAWYDGPTDRYPHGVLGDEIEATELHLAMPRGNGGCIALSLRVAPTLVFEDTAPRLADLTGDGRPELITVQSDRRLGARLAVFAIAAGADGPALRPVMQTPFIGRRNRWLAPVGVGDLDGDGAMEIAYIDRPHLARILRVWRVTGDGLVQIADLEGLTNHRIGDPTIPGGLRDCGTGPEMITADAAWRQVMATRLSPAGRLETRSIGPWTPGALAAALAC
jgi:hypothetical protein